MTISYQLAGVGPAAALTNHKATIAARLGRIAPLNREYSSSGVLAPYVIPWTISTDNNGVDFPDGLVGVVGDYANGAGPSSYTSLIDTYFANNCVPVPGVLPGGYTPRLKRDCFWSSSTTGQARVSPSNTYYRDANGPVHDLWVPKSASLARGYTFSGSSKVIVLGPGYDPHPLTGTLDEWIMYTIEANSIGYRKLTYQTTYHSTDDEPTAAWKHTSTLTVSHNADGSDFGDDNGDTIDHIQNLVYGDYTRTDTLGHPGIDRWLYTSPVIDCGAILPSLGVVSKFKIKCHMGGTNELDGFPNYQAPGLYQTMSFKASPNIIPFPFTCTGDGDLIAPGGIV